MCAALNAAGWAQGCATSDVDALLFGARTVYRQLHLQVEGAGERGEGGRGRKEGFSRVTRCCNERRATRVT